MKDKGNASSRRQFLKHAAAGAGLAVASSALLALADHHPHPTPNSLTYLDRRMYIQNMEIIAHIEPGGRRGGKINFMAIGNRRYLVQQGDIIDVSDLHKPAMYNRKCFEGGQVQAAFNKDLKNGF